MQYEIKEKIATLSENKVYSKEINVISWDQSPVKYDIRLWRLDNGHPSKGLTFTKQELKDLRNILNRLELD